MPIWTESSGSGACKLYPSNVNHWRMGESANTFYKRLAAMMSEKRSTEYNKTIHWIRFKLSFALLRASIMSIRGARSSKYHAAEEPCQPIDLQLAEGDISWIRTICTFLLFSAYMIVLVQKIYILLSFSLLWSSLLCIRGTRSHTHNAIKNSDISIELALSESHLN